MIKTSENSRRKTESKQHCTNNSRCVFKKRKWRKETKAALKSVLGTKRLFRCS